MNSFRKTANSEFDKKSEKYEQNLNSENLEFVRNKQKKRKVKEEETGKNKKGEKKKRKKGSGPSRRFLKHGSRFIFGHA